jgi:hypothetical protein
MNAYTHLGKARLGQHEITDVLVANRMTASAHLAALERQRGWMAEAELERLVKENGLESPVSGSRIAMLRQTLGATLVRAGERLAGASLSTVAPEPSGKVGIAS